VIIKYKMSDNQENKKKEHYTSNTTKVVTGSTLGGVLWLVFIMFSLYLSFKCNNGINWKSFIFAGLCPIIYVPYKLATWNNCHTSVATRYITTSY